ncbi:hypothetical protein AGOR_G00211020 [Albula goreensis]|uniref:Uncharacterized protein n=1 Tax=Albula goreensis TaxID=1534307 RepID=A0A8T3CUH0_9TELE|nr:hypothetical protein AGOR_G00211020 [Albula goreensis]
MALHSNMFVCSKRFLTKMFRFDVMNTNLRYLKNAQVNLDFQHSTNLQCRHTCFGSLSNRLFPTQSQARDLRNSRFYTDMHRSTGDFNENSLNTFEASTDSMDSETENDPRRRTSHVFNIDVLVALLRQENGADICVIKVPKEMRYTDYFVVVSGSSTRHLRAMAFYAVKVYKYLKQDSDHMSRSRARMQRTGCALTLAILWFTSCCQKPDRCMSWRSCGPCARLTSS